MMKALMILLSVAMISCGSPTETPKTAATPAITADEVMAKFHRAGLPIENVIVYTAETDLDQLLGKPNQYIEKINWSDQRIAPEGGTVEVFQSKTDLESRKKSIENVAQSLPIRNEYLIEKGNALIRLHQNLTPAQVKEYEDALK